MSSLAETEQTLLDMNFFLFWVQTSDPFSLEAYEYPQQIFWQSPKRAAREPHVQVLGLEFSLITSPRSSDNLSLGNSTRDFKS